MHRFIPYILKTLWRHRVRTLLTVSGCAVALFVFCFVAAVQEGLEDLRRREEGQRLLVVFQANKFCPATSHLPQDYEPTIARVPGVREVVPMQVFTNNCRASLDVVVFYGVPAEKLRSVRAFTLLRGGWDDFQQHQDAAAVGRAVAARRRLNIGDRFSIGEITVTVAAIYACHNRVEENYVYTHLDFLQRRNRQSLVGTVTQFEVQLEDGAGGEFLGREIDEALRDGPVRTDTRPKGVFQTRSLGDLTDLINLAHYLGLASIGMVLALVATTTFMAVQDRVREHAVLQTLGFSGLRIFALVMSESVLLSLVGGALGVGFAMAVLRWGGLAIGAEAVTIAFTPSADVAAMGLAVALGTGVVAGFAPGWQAAGTEIVPALRSA
jgi:putative ABC transport system permease protein